MCSLCYSDNILNLSTLTLYSLVFVRLISFRFSLNYLSEIYQLICCRTDYDNENEIGRCLGGIDENLEEIDKISFICSCILDSLQMGGSALIPVGRLGVVLLLLEQLSRLLESSHLKVLKQ